MKQRLNKIQITNTLFHTSFAEVSQSIQVLNTGSEYHFQLYFIIIKKALDEIYLYIFFFLLLNI